MIIIKTPDEIDHMRESCRMAAVVLDRVAQKVTPGVSTGDLDAYAQEEMKSFGAESAFFGYRGYPGHICVSINDEVVHGIPGARRIQMGDVVSLDVGVLFEGFYGDTATSVMVGVSDPALIRLARVGEEALEAAISKAVAGGRLGDVCHAIESAAIEGGFSVVRDFVGHGVGRSLHEDPQIPNFGAAGKGPKLKVGMTLAIEPMINMGSYEVEVLKDGWTVRTMDRKPSVHFEHTIAIRQGPAEVLTCVKKK